MDCKTARLLLDFDRPGAPELERADAAALEGHLAGCPHCDTLAHSERQFDVALGRAMRQVVVPDGLRSQLLARLEAERGAWYRHWYGHGLRALAAAAAVLLLVWGWWYWHADQARPVQPEGVVEAINLSRTNRDDVQASLKALGVAAELPRGLNYAYLLSHAVRELPGHPGTKVALLVFSHNDRLALVYVLPARQFDVTAAASDFSGYAFKLKVVGGPGDPYPYLVLYNGESADWLNAPEPAAT
ncbi:MAG TPA: hypothetical protein VFE78_35530 [Gemmataceae bacterium]|nr:hypothetical protein [Gemmataceae bacterium]